MKLGIRMPLKSLISEIEKDGFLEEKKESVKNMKF